MAKVLLHLVLGATVFMLVSCGDRHTACVSSNASVDTTDLRVALMPTIDCLPFYVAHERGIYRKLGLNVDITTYRSMHTCGQSLADGRKDVSFLSLPEAVYLKAHGTNLKILMRTEGNVDIFSNKTKRIKKLSNMRERLVAVTRHSTSEYLVDEIARITGIAKFEILRPQINDIFIRRNMLENNQVDAVAMPEPYASLLRRAGHVKVFSTENSGEKLGCMATNSSTTAAKSKELRILLKGYTLAAAELSRNRKKADSILIKTYSIRPDETDSVKIPAYPSPRLTDSNTYGKVMKWCVDRKYVEKPISEKELTLPDYIKR